ncbi:hypothetical protein [Mycolicibacterium houstonense]|uniref:hypothetical protein n=1 Tax=Mycolicibacterium houstonense TaxID=146021 RepID=UPI003F97DA91
MTNPGYVNLGELPADTIIQEAKAVTLAVSAAPDGSGQLVPQLVIAADDLGMYRFIFGRQVLTSFINQCLVFSQLTAEELNAITHTLTPEDGEA